MFFIKKNILIGRAALLLFILLALVYYNLFVVNRDIFSNSIIQLTTNQHDHNIYLYNMDLIREGYSLFEFANDKGIAIIYLVLSQALPFLVAPEMELISFLFNCFVLILNYWIYGKIADELGLGLLGRLSFFYNLSLLYFAQLINKDMLTIFVFLLAAYAGMKRKHLLLLLLIPFAAYIRIQLIVFILIFVFLSPDERFKIRFFLVYIMTSLIAAYLSVAAPIIGDDSLGDGFSAYLIDLNNRYLIGYLIFNPVRLLQYIYDAYLSFNIFSENGAIDGAKILRLPQLVLLATLTTYFFKAINRWDIYEKTFVKPLVVTVLAYACTWLMNPTVNARYVMLITPILVLMGLYIRSTQQRKAYSHV